MGLSIKLPKIPGIKAASKINQSLTRLNVKPTPGKKCQRENRQGRVSGLIKGKGKATSQKACIEKAKKVAFFTFFMGVLGMASKFRNSESLTPKKVNGQEKFSDDTLTVAQPRVVQGSFSPEPNRGISVFSPEILSVLSFKPIYTGDPKQEDFSREGRMIETQHQASKIRQESLLQLHTSMKERGPRDTETADQIFKKMQQNFQTTLERTNQLIDILGESVERIDEISGRFDIKRMWANRGDEASLKALKPFFEEYLGYGEKQFEAFSNTKILAQFLSDFRQVLENYSFGLLDLVDSDRPGDFDPIKIDTTTTKTDGFRFSSAMMRSTTTPINAANRRNSDRFLKALPKDPGDRIKILINFLSKEYRVSRVLGNKGGLDERLKSDWGASTQGSPFDNIIGEAGKTIFDQPKGSKSLLSLLYTNTTLVDQPGTEEGDFTILPFEEKYVDSEDKSFVPGSSFFIDRLFDLTQFNNFNKGPLTQYVDHFQTQQSKAMNMVLFLFQIAQNGTPVQNDLQPDIMYSRFMDSLKEATGGIHNGLDDDGRLARESLQSFSIALMRLSNDNRKLKNLLFQYLLMMGIISNIDNNPGSVWADLAVELGDIKNLPAIKVPRRYKPSTSLLDGPKVITPFVGKIAKKIENQVRKIILPNGGKKTKIRLNPRLTIFAARRFQKYGVKPFSRLGKPISMAVTTNFITSALKQIAFGTTFEKDPNIFREFVDIAAKLTEAATSGDNKGYLLDDTSGRTRFNFVSTSHQLLAIFEILASVVEKFGFCDMRLDVDVVVETNAKLTRFIRLHIKDMTSGRFDKETTTLGAFEKAVRAEFGTSRIGEYVEEQTKTRKHDDEKLKQPVVIPVGEASKAPTNAVEHNLKDSLGLIRTKLSKENQIIINFLWILQLISKDLKDAKNKTQNYFNADFLSLLFQAGTAEEIRIIRNAPQLRLAAFLNDDLKLRARQSFAGADVVLQADEITTNPIVSNSVHDNVKEAMYMYLREPGFQEKAEASTLMKIFSVGVPQAFIRNTQDRIDFKNIRQGSFKEKEADVITVNVHKRDLRRPELVFKPQKFLFDTSLFQCMSDVVNTNPQPGEGHDVLIRKNAVTDYTRLANKKKYYLHHGDRGGNMLQEAKYAFLTNAEKIELLENHYQSSLLETYIKLTTGMAINEKIFALNVEPVEEVMESGFEALLLSYVKDILGEDIPENQSVQELLDNPDVSLHVKDILRSTTSGQVLTVPETERAKTLGPKKFDRVFHVPVDIDNFEVDLDATRETDSGTRALEKAALQNVFREENRFLGTEDNSKPVFLKKRTSRDIIFEDFFVTLESTND